MNNQYDSFKSDLASDEGVKSVFKRIIMAFLSFFLCYFLHLFSLFFYFLFFLYVKIYSVFVRSGLRLLFLSDLQNSKILVENSTL